MQKFSFYKLWLVGALLGLSALACNFPGTTPPTPFVYPTVNLTMTAVFQPTATQLPTVFSLPTSTLPVIAASATSLPSATQIPPTDTNVPVVPITPIYPTATPVPVVYYDGPGERNARSILAYYQDTEIYIDGVFDEWALDPYTVDDVVYGANNWRGDEDLFASVMWSWDEDYLYLAARVIDDRYVQNSYDVDLWRGDSLDLLIDTDVSSDFYYPQLSPDDFQLGISPGSPDPGDDPEAYLWYPNDEEGRRRRVVIGATYIDDGYRVEAAIPWATFDVDPRSGDHFGLAFSVSDNDRSSVDEQQSMISSVRTRVLTDPTTWGDFVLSKKKTSSFNPPPPPPTSRPPTARPPTPLPVEPTKLPPPDRGNSTRRPGAIIEAGYLNNAPIIDGSLADWNVIPYSVAQIVYGPDQWGGPNDLSGVLRVGWNDLYLYFGLEVEDDEYRQRQSGEDIFLGDSLEILVDADLPGDFNRDSLTGDDFQLGISPGTPRVGQNMSAYLWYPRSLTGARNDIWLAAVPTGDGYIMEFAIPWSLFNLAPRSGLNVGFVFSISDNDSSNRDVQQTMVSNTMNRVLTNPTTWGNLTLR